MTRVGSENAWVKRTACLVGEPLAQVGGRVAGFQSQSGFTCGCGYLLLSAGITSYCLGKRRGGSRRESQGSCDEAPRSARSAEGRSSTRWAWSCVSTCGSMEPGG